jgi:hypothetical protein
VSGQEVVEMKGIGPSNVLVLGHGKVNHNFFVKFSKDEAERDLKLPPKTKISKALLTSSGDAVIYVLTDLDGKPETFETMELARVRADEISRLN